VKVGIWVAIERGLKMIEFKNDQLLVYNDYIYFRGKINIAGIETETFCRQKIEKRKVYVLNKNRNVITENKEIFDEYLNKKMAGIWGYKTIKMGVIERYPFKKTVEYQIPCSDGKIDWWVDWEGKVKITSRLAKQINDYIKIITSKFEEILV